MYTCQPVTVTINPLNFVKCSFYKFMLVSCFLCHSKIVDVNESDKWVGGGGGWG